jgi:PTH2 family peptidyl-tRNA hydrolase
MNKLMKAALENEVDTKVLEKVLAEDTPSVEEVPKQWIILRKDLNMRKGKMVAQGSHGVVGAIFNNYTEFMGDAGDCYLMIPLTPVLEEWLVKGSFTKICLSATSEQELRDVITKAELAGLNTKLIIDNGLTEFNGVKTLTCGVIGPAYPSQVKGICDHLPLL